MIRVRGVKNQGVAVSLTFVRFFRGRTYKSHACRYHTYEKDGTGRVLRFPTHVSARDSNRVNETPDSLLLYPLPATTVKHWLNAQAWKLGTSTEEKNSISNHNLGHLSVHCLSRSDLAFLKAHSRLALYVYEVSVSNGFAAVSSCVSQPFTKARAEALEMEVEERVQELVAQRMMVQVRQRRGGGILCCQYQHSLHSCFGGLCNLRCWLPISWGFR